MPKASVAHPNSNAERRAERMRVCPQYEQGVAQRKERQGRRLRGCRCAMLTACALYFDSYSYLLKKRHRAYASNFLSGQD